MKPNLASQPLLTLLIALAVIVVAACAGPTPTPTPVPKATAAPAAAPKPTAAPAASTAATPAAAPKPTAPAVASPAAAADRLQQLYEAAKKEGLVVWNTTVTDGTYQPAFDAFMRRFPEVKLQNLAVGSAEVAGRVVTEHGAGKLSMDVSNQSITSLFPLLERNWVVPQDFSGVNVNKARIYLDSRVVRLADLPQVIFYNKNLVPEAQAPRTWEDLLDPRWKGKIVFIPAVNDLVALPMAWGEQRATEYVQKLGKQEVRQSPRVATLVDAVTRGEAAIGGATLTSIYDAMTKGQPLAVAPISPEIAFLTMAATFERSPHPNAAKLLMAWLATDEAQQALTAGGRLSYAKEALASHPQGRILLDNKIELQFEDTIEKSKLIAKVREEYPKLLGFTPQ